MKIEQVLLLGGVLTLLAVPAHADEEQAAVPTAEIPASGSAVGQKKREVIFNVWEFQIIGNTLIDRTQVERTVYPFLGPARTIEDVEAARAAQETFYNNSGFPTVVVNLPEQNVTEGVVKLVKYARTSRLWPRVRCLTCRTCAISYRR
jgi:hemolysin activation/secretion protein